MVSQKRSSSVSLSDLLGTRKRRSKHGNVKTTIGSEKYDSKREASRHQSLLLEQRAGSIAGLRRQVRYMLIPSQRRADGKAERPVMPGVPAALWFAIHRRAEPKVRAAFAAAQKACPGYVIKSAAAWVYRHMNRPDLANPPLSIHSWGAAVDIDPPTNGLRTRTIVPYSAAWLAEYPAGLPQAWVEGFCSVGGIDWGGAWRSPVDPMHSSVYDPEG